MSFRPFIALAAVVVLVAACSSGGATTAPTQAPAAPSAEASVAPSADASAPAAEASCVVSMTAGEVAVSIKDFQFNPATIEATVGQTVTFTNEDSAPHTATLDDGACTTKNLGKGDAEGLTFNAAGSFPFHCKVHPDMTGTIKVS